jgi:ABC-type multidrug transport system fused ATPase/permease subunit
MKIVKYFLLKLVMKTVMFDVLKSFSILNRNEKIKLGFIAIMQSLLNLLDLIGVALIGILGSLTITGVSMKKAGNRTESFLNWLQISELDIKNQIIILGFLAAFFLAFKSLFSMYFNRKILYFLSRGSARSSSNLLNLMLGSNILTINKRSVQEIIWSLTNGIQMIYVGVIGTTLSIFSDGFLLLLLFSTLLVVDIKTAMIAILIFTSVGVILNLSMKSYYVKVQEKLSRVLIKTNEKTNEIILSFREIFVRGRQLFYAHEISSLRKQSADSSAEIAFLQNISKYVIELILVIGILLIIGTQFATQSPGRAVGVISIFIASATRIAPAILRIQQGLLTIRGNAAGAKLTFDLLAELKQDIKIFDNSLGKPDLNYQGFNPEIIIRNLNFKYPGNSEFEIKNIDLEIKPQTFFAIVGKSGSGKSTLVDLILGILQPDSGKILISNTEPSEAIKRWPGAIGYVPQEVFLQNGTVYENIIQGFEVGELPNELIENTVQVAQLTNVIDTLKNGIQSQIGDRGSKLSGGQRQRIGIARALVTKPKILVLDEATSSLDSDTENKLSNEILTLKRSTTLIVIAHRLSTIKNADTIIYLENGAIVASGTFEQVRKLLPEFENQINQMKI